MNPDATNSTEQTFFDSNYQTRLRLEYPFEDEIFFNHPLFKNPNHTINILKIKSAIKELQLFLEDSEFLQEKVINYNELIIEYVVFLKELLVYFHTSSQQYIDLTILIAKVWKKLGIKEI